MVKPRDLKSGAFKDSIITLFIAEVVGTALLMFLGCMACITEVVGIPTAFHFPVVAFGLVVMIVVVLFGHISGAHINPAVTLVALVLGNFKYLKTVVYIVAQFTGAILGFGLLKLLVPEEYVATEIFSEEKQATIHRVGLCSTVPHSKVNAFQAMGIEAIITGVLALLCCAVWDKRNACNTDSTALKFGFAIAGLCLAAAPFTGASLNTARSFAPALLNGDWNDHWVYWVGPNLGAVAASFFYKLIYSPPKESPVDQEELENVTSIATRK